MNSNKKNYKAFVSYAHADKIYFDLLMKGIRVQGNGLDVDFDIWGDNEIPIGKDWHKFIQNKIQECDFAILFISGNFLHSDYIAEQELKKFIVKDYEDDFFIFPILILPCNYNKDVELAKRQIFICSGADYERPNIQDLTYADLVSIGDDWSIKPNAARERYHIALVNKIIESIKHHKLKFP